MKKYRLILWLFLMTSGVVLVSAQVTQRDEDDIKNIDHIERTDPELALYIREYIKADKVLNTAYTTLMKIYETPKDFPKESIEGDKAKLKAAQLAWLKYRDLAVKSDLSIHTSRMEYYESLTALTQQRANRLKDLLRRMSEGFNGKGPYYYETPAKAALEQLKKLETED